VTLFYVGCHKPTTALLLYSGLGQAVNGALTELKKQSSQIRKNADQREKDGENRRMQRSFKFYSSPERIRIW